MLVKLSKIVAEVSEADDTDEAGKLSLFVAEYLWLIEKWIKHRLRATLEVLEQLVSTF